MRTRVWSLGALWGGALMLATVGSLHATNGDQLIGIGAVQKATAGAGVASAKDATWVLLNPAAIDDLRLRLDVGLEFFAPERSITPDGPDLEDLGGQPLANRDAGRMEDSSVFWIPFIGAVRDSGSRSSTSTTTCWAGHSTCPRRCRSACPGRPIRGSNS